MTGALDGAFERMMFLTATPFQLGHHELINVIGIFRGIAWKTLPQSTKEKFVEEVKSLGDMLDRAQHRAAELDKRWPSLRQDDLADAESGSAHRRAMVARRRIQSHGATRARSGAAKGFRPDEKRHEGGRGPAPQMGGKASARPRASGHQIPRRSRRVGRAIALSGVRDGGLPVEEDALLPFLLAARAQAVVVREAENAGRATFAEGLASSYEAFLETRSNHAERDEEEKEETSGTTASNGRVNRYVQKLAAALPDQTAYARHPKIAPLVARVLDLWNQGEKVVVFCHYRETGRALVRHLLPRWRNGFGTTPRKGLASTTETSARP